LCSWCLKIDRPWSNTKSILVFKKQALPFSILVSVSYALG
jgi:hypothetical protein